MLWPELPRESVGMFNWGVWTHATLAMLSIWPSVDGDAGIPGMDCVFGSSQYSTARRKVRD